MLRFLSAAFMGLAIVGGLWGQSSETPDSPQGKFSVEGARIVGGDLGYQWQSTKLIVGAGYENWQLGRDSVGAPQNSPLSWWAVSGSATLSQIWLIPEAELWVGLGGMGYNALGHQPTLGNAFSDLAAGAFGFVQAGAVRDRMRVGAHGVKEGSKISVVVETSPSWLSMTRNDYSEISLRSALLLPLWNLEAPAHLWSGTLGLRFNAQWIDGTAVPLPLLEPTEVRGYEATYDTKFRSVATAELRVGLPSLWDDHSFMPMVFAFSEGGWHAGYADTSVSASQSVWLASAGAGLGFSVLGLTTVTLTVATPLLEAAPRLWWKSNFNLRF